MRGPHVRAVTDDGLLRNARVCAASAELQPYGIQAHNGLCAAVPTQTYPVCVPPGTTWVGEGGLTAINKQVCQLRGSNPRAVACSGS